MAADDRFVITAIVLARLALPLLIPRIPLIILGTLVLDAADNSLLAHFSSVDLGPAGPYQSFDKALDTYTLAVAHLATMRNWIPATPTGRAVARAGRWRGRGVHFALLLPVNFLLI
ncbi:MAG TPA: hypothetical protein VKQ32_12450 [Polyangia bacterium]|nr:hypothetical protein [Polyangia bacterium]